MKKYLFIFGLVMISFAFLSPVANAAPACGASDDVWTPSSPVEWRSGGSRSFDMEQGYSVGAPPSGGQEWPYTFSGSCTAAAVNGARCDVQCISKTEYQDFAACPSLEQRLTYCQSPANRIDGFSPTCGNWSGSGPTFTLANSVDAPASGDSGMSGIKIAGGTCMVSGSGTCTVDIYDVALNKTTCTSPVYTVPAPTYSCSGANPTNASMCFGDDSGLTGPTNKTLVSGCSVPDKCEFTCDSGYIYQNTFGFASCVPVPTSLTCSPASQTIGVGLGARVGASGGDGTYNWGVSGSNCFGEVEPGNSSVYWAGCNSAGWANVVVSDNSGHQASCALTVTSGVALSCSPATQTVAELQGASFSATGGFGTLRWSTSGSPYGSPMAGTGSTFWTSYGQCGEKTITVTDDLGASASCGLTVTGASCMPGTVCNFNGAQDNGETGVDCGGGGCAACSVPPGSCPRYWESNPHYVCEDYACARVDACGSDSDGCTALRVGLECGQPSAVGTVNVSSNSSSATWLLDGPQNVYAGSGTYRSYPNLPAPGSYTLVSTKAGCVVNSPTSQLLWPDGTINFNITCGTLPTCWISAIPSSETATVGSNVGFTATTTCSDGSTPSDNINLTDWSVNKSASFVSGENNSRTTTLKCDSPTGGTPATVTPHLGSLIPIASTLTCNPALTCSPVSQTVDINQNANFSAAGGTTYSWIATGGTPASGSSSSFTTKYSSIGNKTVSVSSGGNNASCSVTVIQPKHNECVMSGGAPACAVVDGRAPDRCSTVADCGGGVGCNYNGVKDNGETGVDCGGGGCPACTGGTPLKYSCASGSCQPDSAGQYTDSTCGGVCAPTYYSCSNGSCSPDADGQFTSADCNNMCVAPIYGRCSATSMACVNTTDSAGAPCSGDLTCGTTGETHLGCVGNACVIMSGSGSDECNSVGEACATGGGGVCSLKAAPPLVSGGQSVKLTWQCSGSPTCSLTRKYKNSSTVITLQDPATRTVGSYSEKPQSSATYKLDCENNSADATADVKVSTLIECAPTDPTCKP